MSQEIRLHLTRLFDELASTLAEFRRESGCDASGDYRAQSSDPREIAYEAAMECITNRRARQKHFPSPELFGEPAWDILLELYVQNFENHDVSVKSATIGSGVPASTALRWLHVLEERGLISSYVDTADHRRRFVRLTPEGCESMTRYLNEIAR